jgi:hypothetical protein
VEENYYFENEYGEMSSILIKRVEKIGKYLNSNGGTLEEADFYRGYWEDNGWGEIIFNYSGRHWRNSGYFPQGEDELVYFTNLDFDPDALDPKYTPINIMN